MLPQLDATSHGKSHIPCFIVLPFHSLQFFMERSLICNRQIANATADYQSELKELLKTAKQEKITKFFKPLLKPEDNM